MSCRRREARLIRRKGESRGREGMEMEGRGKGHARHITTRSQVEHWVKGSVWEKNVRVATVYNGKREEFIGNTFGSNALFLPRVTPKCFRSPSL